MKPEQSQLHILIVDDDNSIRVMLSEFLRGHGLRTSEAANGAEMFAILEKSSADLILLDIMMPGDDGLTLCRKLQSTSQIPVIILTAVDTETDRIIGLEIGADDYVIKPFSPRELLARIRTILRRVSGKAKPSEEKPSIFRFSGWIVDIKKRTLTSPENIFVVLTSTEFDLLVVFTENPQKVLTRDHLMEALHGRSVQQYDRAIDVQISRLRRKIEQDVQNPELIKTIRNEGYFFTPDVESGDLRL